MCKALPNIAGMPWHIANNLSVCVWPFTITSNWWARLSMVGVQSSCSQRELWREDVTECYVTQAIAIRLHICSVDGLVTSYSGKAPYKTLARTSAIGDMHAPNSPPIVFGYWLKRGLLVISPSVVIRFMKINGAYLAIDNHWTKRLVVPGALLHATGVSFQWVPGFVMNG